MASVLAIRLAVFAATVLVSATAWAQGLTVQGPAGEVVPGWYWTLEENTLHPIEPGVSPPDTLAVRFHRSYMTVVGSGDETTDPFALVDPLKHYFLSVLPKGGFSNSGAPIKPGQGSVTVVVQPLPIPTAQVTVFVFEDNHPINNFPDLPAEHGLEGFTVAIGELAGAISQDAFGNPLGTSYLPCPPLPAPCTPVVDVIGTGLIKTDATGRAVIRNLPPGKYEIQILPPAGQGWQQTSTIEGSKVIDAWVRANEPPYFIEAGEPRLQHAFFGFVRPFADATALNGSGFITGQVVNLHNGPPPIITFDVGGPFPVTIPWVGLNDPTGLGVYAARANTDGTFTIPNVPPGVYQLVIWDEYLDLIFAFRSVTVPATGGLDVGKVAVFSWFGSLYSDVFEDPNENGFRDPGEAGIPEQAINLRFRDGTIYQSYPTDTVGFVPFDEVFPYFNWLVAEVDFLRHKATGVTVVVDAGGPIDAGATWPAAAGLGPEYAEIMTPQPQSENGGAPFRTETGPVLLEGFQLFQGQTIVLQWGKTAYGLADEDNAPFGDFPGPGDVDNDGDGVFDEGNGGISGIVHYSTTRAEDDPRFGTAEEWEPGIARVTVRLYDSTGTILLNEVQTDSWDDSPPTGCQGTPFIHKGVPADCYDGLRNYNQVRPAVFDGGYAFNSRFLPSYNDPLAVESPGIPAGNYVVQVIPPPGYEIVKEEDKNVDFGDEYVPAGSLATKAPLGSSKNALPIPPLAIPLCVGDPHVVPAELDLFPGVPAAFAGQTRPLCDKKLVRVTNGQNGAANFFLFTRAPIAAHVVGTLLDDTANEGDLLSPQFGEKYAPPYLPVSFLDWTGREVVRVYADEFGRYNALVPSTYSVHVPTPSGVSPNVVTVCLNDPVMPDPANPGQFIPEPHFNPRYYPRVCLAFQFMPGRTTYLDTPIFPMGAFAGQDQFPVDCEFCDKTPVIGSVLGPTVMGPYVAPLAGDAVSQTLTIVAVGDGSGNVQVPNPAYEGAGGGTPQFVTRDFGFGSTPGMVTVGGVPLTDLTWSAGIITGRVPPGTASGQLIVKRGDNGMESLTGITVTVGSPTDTNIKVVPPGGKIQPVIDLADAGDLIIVPPGNYPELLVMWKPVRLQGAGAGSTRLAVSTGPSDTLTAWTQKITSVLGSGAVSLVPGQTGTNSIELFGVEGSAVTVLAKDAPVGGGGFGLVGGAPNARIDGFTVTGADVGGGIYVNGYAHHLQIGNNRIASNAGFFGGGVRIGIPGLTVPGPGGLQYQGAFNDHVRIHNNQIIFNSASPTEGTANVFGLGNKGAGAGVALFAGSDAYEIVSNWICGNFSLGDGGGIGHTGLSPGGLIADNEILFNELFLDERTASGAGIFVSGDAPLGTGLTPGSGSITIANNRIQGNQAAAGNGGGIALQLINGADVPGRPSSLWHRIDIVNNIIANNIAAGSGAGISIGDATKVTIIHNTITKNDSLATAGELFSAAAGGTTPRPAGIASRVHSRQLLGASGQVFSNPILVNNIIYQNRSFFFSLTAHPGQTPPWGLLPDPSTPSFWDLGVLGAGPADKLDPRFSILTDPSGYHVSNIPGPPSFGAEYFNGNRSFSVLEPERSQIDVPLAFDEGGNFIRPRFGPLTLKKTDGSFFGDYHVTLGRPGQWLTGVGGLFGPDLSSVPDNLEVDFDRERRVDAITPRAYSPHRGADQLVGGPVANIPPIADNQAVVTTPGVPKAVTLTATDLEGAALSFMVVSGPLNGSLSGTPPAVTYTPNPLFTGFDSFTFKANDGMDDSNVATVTVSVTGILAVDDTASAKSGIETIIPVLANDIGTNLQIKAFTQPANGVVTKEGTTIKYKVNETFAGSETFTYTMTNGVVTSNSATVTVTVVPNSPPFAISQTVSTIRNTALPITLGALDINGDPLTFRIVTQPAHGKVTGGKLPARTYTPASGYVGPDSFTFVANDGKVDSAPATVSITVLPGPNTVPVASNQSVTTAQNTAKNITLGPATDVDGDSLTYMIVTGPAHGTVSGGTLRTRTYTPATGYSGPDSFTFKANDGQADSNVATVSITVTAAGGGGGGPLLAVNDAYTVRVGVETLLTVGANDTGAPFTIQSFTQGAKGKVSRRDPNLKYKAKAGTAGMTDTFTYTITNGVTTSTATVTLTIVP